MSRTAFLMALSLAAMALVLVMFAEARVMDDPVCWDTDGERLP